jgi:hypothetical protein
MSLPPSAASVVSSGIDIVSSCISSTGEDNETKRMEATTTKPPPAGKEMEKLVEVNLLLEARLKAAIRTRKVLWRVTFSTSLGLWTSTLPFPRSTAW